MIDLFVFVIDTVKSRLKVAIQDQLLKRTTRQAILKIQFCIQILLDYNMPIITLF